MGSHLNDVKDRPSEVREEHPTEPDRQTATPEALGGPSSRGGGSVQQGPDDRELGRQAPSVQMEPERLWQWFAMFSKRHVSHLISV